MFNTLSQYQAIIPNIGDLHGVLDCLFEPNRVKSLVGFSHRRSDWLLKVDIQDQESQYVIHADVPGVKSKDIDVHVENDILVIKGHKETQVKEENKGLICVERYQGSFYRSIMLPEAIDAIKVTAEVKEGVLKIVASKSKKSAGQKIQVR